ncbi:hypothetical protein J6590_032173 [Homalodisca vitripennis]|nr:hypothetical protein J6590_032173 [Homalodisca vitripennis]
MVRKARKQLGTQRKTSIVAHPSRVQVLVLADTGPSAKHGMLSSAGLLARKYWAASLRGASQPKGSVLGNHEHRSNGILGRGGNKIEIAAGFL